MKGYVARKGRRWYAVIYDGLDPVTGRERRTWHPAGTERADAEVLAARLAADLNGRKEEVRSLTFGAYLTTRWLPGKKLSVAPSTWVGYRYKVEHHILPAIGRIPIRRLRAEHLEALYQGMLHPSDGRRAAAMKSVLAVHQIIRAALADAVRRSILARNVAEFAHAPRLRSIPTVEPQVWTREETQAFLHAAAGHWLFPAFWLAAGTGMRRSEILGLQWDDIDFDHGTIAVNRGLVAIDHALSVNRCKTRSSRRPVKLGSVTLALLRGWRDWHRAELAALKGPASPWVFAHPDGRPIHPDVFSKAFERVAARAGVPVIRLHDLRHTHATLLVEAGVDLKVVSERLGHRDPRSPCRPTSTSLTACKPRRHGWPRSSLDARIRLIFYRSNFYRADPVETAVEARSITVEGPISTSLTRAFSSGGRI